MTELAWSSSLLGDPGADGDDFRRTEGRIRGDSAAKLRTAAALAAVLLGTVGVGAALSIAITEYVGSPTSTSAVVVPGAAGAPTADTPAPARIAAPTHSTIPAPFAPPAPPAPPTFKVPAPPIPTLPPLPTSTLPSPCQPQPFCI